MEIIKRDGSKEEFKIEKVINAIDKCFKEVGSYNVHDETNLMQEIMWLGVFVQKKDQFSSVEDIQDYIEKTLMRLNYFEEAKAFILYRKKHTHIRDFVSKKLQFINNYIESDNTANATIDDNSNVNNHNVAVLNSELHKEENKEINLKIWQNKLKELYPDFDSKQMLKDFDSIAYPHDISSQVGMPYCVAITMYPFLLDGIKNIGGLSATPKNLDSFCGMFTNLIFAIASQYKGAVAAPGVWLCMDYFCRKEWGENYHLDKDKFTSNPELCKNPKTIQKQIHQYFQQICYTLMQPTGSRGNQACFWNCSIFDKTFFDTMYGDFYFPDSTQPNWESFNWLQKEFMHWLNQERLKCVLTFPVVSACLIYEDGEFKDKELAEFVAQEYSEGNSFFTYINDSPESLSSCCRLSSKISKPQFNFTNGQLSEMTGSKNVITLNLNRILQDYMRRGDIIDYPEVITGYTESGSPIVNKWRISNFDKNEHYFGSPDGFKEYLIAILDRIYKYQTAYNELLKDMYNADMLTVYNAGFIDMKKQYLTIGINGLNQAAEFLGIKCNKNKYYEDFCNLIFTTIKEENAKHKTKDLMFNTEFTPCESASIKLYNRDKKDGYVVPTDTNLYASYIFKPNDAEISILDKIYLHGKNFCGDNLDGGSAAHLNLDAHLSIEQYRKILKYAAEVGCKYFTFNIPNCECEDCGYIAKQPFGKCPKCGSENVSLWDRVIGYLTKIKNWSKGRQIEQKTRVYKHDYNS